MKGEENKLLSRYGLGLPDLICCPSVSASRDFHAAFGNAVKEGALKVVLTNGGLG